MFKEDSDIYRFIDMIDRAEADFSIHITNTQEIWVVEVPIDKHSSVFIHFDYYFGKITEINIGDPGWDIK